MRLRNVKGSRETIAANDYVINEPEKNKGRWSEVFGNENPIMIEIGMGKGKFIMELAKQNPDINYVGIEKYSSVLVRALEKLEEDPRENLLLIRMEAENINDIFDEDEVDRIYLNFSDPWPKDRHAKRRLTSREFLARYDKLLKKDGYIQFKTDNNPLFDFSLEETEAAGWKTKEMTRDFHHSEYIEGNIMTEYEEKFSSMGNPINRVIIYRN